MIQARGLTYRADDASSAYKKTKELLEQELDAKNLHFNPRWMPGQSCTNRFYDELNFYMGELDSSCYVAMIGLTDNSNILRLEVSSNSPDTIEQILQTVKDHTLKSLDLRNVEEVFDCSVDL